MRSWPSSGAMPSSAATPEAGSPGRVQLAFAAPRPGGATVLTRRYATHPLAVRPAPADPGVPGQAHIIILNQGGGVLAGDALRIEVDVGPGATAHIGGVGATRLHPTPGGASRQEVALRLGDGARLEWLPDPVIPFAGSVTAQRVEVALGPGALWIGADILAAGRQARGERFAYTSLEQSLQVTEEPSGALLHAEAFRLEPGRRAPDGPGVMAGHAVLGTLRAVTRAVPPAALAEALRAALAAVPADVYAGATALAAGAVVRVLGPALQPVARALRAAWDAARSLCMGVSAPEARRY